MNVLPTAGRSLPPLHRADAAAALAALGATAVECALGDFSSVARGKRVHRDDFLALGGCKLPSVASCRRSRWG